MGFVMRRSLPSLAGLLGLVLLVGAAAVILLHLPLWTPAVVAIALTLLEYVAAPWVIRRLIPARRIAHDRERYDIDHIVGRLLAARCRQAGIPLVRLGVVDDGTPNAFTFGRTRRDAHIWVTRGLLERLDEAELDAVIAHEVGHIKHRDFILMTAAAVIPMLLYLVWVFTRGSNVLQGRLLPWTAYAAYLASQFMLLAFSRAREYAADHWSCQATGDGDALASALVKVAYGMGQAEQEHKAALAASKDKNKEKDKQARRQERRMARAQALRAMGILEPRATGAMAATFEHGIDARQALGAMRWDVTNPWGRTLEKLSSHPLVARRIEALERSGLPGAPRQWSVLRALATANPAEVSDAKARYLRELAVTVAPWAILVPMLLFGAFTQSTLSAGVAIVLAGGLLLVRQHLRYPVPEHWRHWQAADSIAGLLERLDAGPVRGLPVQVHGRVVGRGLPGYVLSPDLVIEDASGFVPLLYRQPLPLVASWFALVRLEGFMGEQVVARGWYRRTPSPVVELREVKIEGGQGGRCWTWISGYGLAWLVIAAGAVTLLFGGTIIHLLTWFAPW